MAVDLLSEASPRYSFSNDINLSGLAPAQPDQSELDTGQDFEFGISESFEQESSSADELFSQGMLLPIQIREQGVLISKQSIIPYPASDQQEQLPITEAKDEDVKEGKPSTFLESEEKQLQSKASFWSFKRSSSLNYDGSECNKKGLLSSLQGLSRSNSTGSVPNPKKSIQNKEKVFNSSKHPPFPKSSSTSSSNSSYYQSHQSPPYSKTYYGGITYSPGGSRTNSVLNIPPPYISNTNLFGLGSLFRNGKDKKPKK